MQDLKVTIIQTDIIWEDPVANLTEFEKKIDSVDEPTDLIILPEMFNTGFTMNAAVLAQRPDGPVLEWMRKMAVKKSCALMGSLIIEEDTKYYNRFYCVFADGKTAYYDKRHLFRMAGEHNIYSSGKTRRIVRIKDWKIGLFVCYDLRFPVWSRVVNRDCDILVFVANWPMRRASHWQLLLKARAVENQAFCIGVNRVGRDGLGIDYQGDSAIIDPLGMEIIALPKSEATRTGTLSAMQLQRFREKFPAWMDSDIFNIKE